MHRAATLLSEWASELADWVWPPACWICARAAGNGMACAAHALPAARETDARPRCARCRAALAPDLPDGETCPECRVRPPAFGALVALGDYGADDGLREWILALKHGGRRDLARPLALLLAERCLAVERFAPPERGAAGDPAAEPGKLLVPVPLHPWRRLERGYDQSWLLARVLGERLGLPARRLLRRTRPTLPQGDPLAPERHANVRDAFAARVGARRELQGKQAWLVDDVVTSGATADACARVLRAAGVRRVGVLCLARA